MRILSDASYRQLRASAEQANLERDRLGRDLSELRARHERICKGYRILERRHQELLLKLELRGMTVEIKPAVPAQPESVVVKVKTK